MNSKRCYGLTKNFKRCKNKGKYLGFCHNHRWQPISWLIGIIGIVGSFASIYPLFSKGDNVTTLEANSTGTFCKPFLENFDSTSLNYFERNGWKVSNYNSELFEKQSNKGALDLHTPHGDLWDSKPNRDDSKRRIINLLVKEIECNTCFIETSIFNFSPYHPWQQAGIYIFNEHEGSYDINNWVKLVFAYGGVNTHPKKSKDEKWWKIVQVAVYKDGEIMDNGRWHHPGIEYDLRWQKRPIEFIKLKIEIKENVFSFKFKKNNDAFPFEYVDNKEELKLEHIKPKYVGIAAYSGWPNVDSTTYGYPFPSDTISSSFDYIKLDDIK